MVNESPGSSREGVVEEVVEYNAIMLTRDDESVARSARRDSCQETGNPGNSSGAVSKMGPS